MNADRAPQRQSLGGFRYAPGYEEIHTTAFVEAPNEEEAEEIVVGLLRNDREFRGIVLSEQSDAPMMFVEEIDELESFEGVNLPGTGFSFFPEEGKEAVEA